MRSYRNSFIQNTPYKLRYTDYWIFSDKLLTVCLQKSYKQPALPQLPKAWEFKYLKRKKILILTDPVDGVRLNLPFLGRMFIQWVFFVWVFTLFLQNKNFEIILTSETESFIKLNAKLVLEMNNGNWKTKIKTMGWTFLNYSLHPSLPLFENQSNLWRETGIWQHLSI